MREPPLRFNRAHALALVSLVLVSGLLAWIEYSATGVLDIARFPIRVAQLLEPALWLLCGLVVLVGLYLVAARLLAPAGPDREPEPGAGTAIQRDDDAQGGIATVLLAPAATLGAKLFTLVVLGLGALAMYRHADGEPPWEGLPGVTPPFIEAFLQRNPGLEVDALGGAERVIVYGAGGARIVVDADTLRAGARIEFETCASPLDARALGGIEPYPGARCVRRVRIRGVAPEQDFYVLDAGAPLADVRSFYRDWALRAGVELDDSGGPRRFTYTVHGGAERRGFELYRRNSGIELYIPAAGPSGP